MSSPVRRSAPRQTGALKTHKNAVSGRRGHTKKAILPQFTDVSLECAEATATKTREETLLEMWHYDHEEFARQTDDYMRVIAELRAENARLTRDYERMTAIAKQSCRDLNEFSTELLKATMDKMPPKGRC